MAPNFRSCPACGTRNKLKWEFCVKCGESLQDVKASAAAPAAAAEPVSAEPGAFNWGGALMTVLALGAAVYAGLRFRPETTRIDPAFFANPARTESEAPKAPVSEARGEERSLNDALRSLKTGDTKTALEQLAQAVADQPRDAEARFAYGHALYQAGQAESALAQFLEAARLEPKHARANADAARVLLGLGRPKEAIPLLEAAVAADPSSPAWLSQLGQLQMNQGNPARAADLFQQAATQSHNNARFLEQMGYALDKAGNSQGAMDAYRKALESDPNASNARALLSERMLAAGRTDDAIALVRQGAERDAKLQITLGSLLERTGRTQEAADAYREYARQNPKAPDAVMMEERAKALESGATAVASSS